MATSGQQYPVFAYVKKDFNFTTVMNEESPFDKLIIERWQAGVEKNVFRYKLNLTNCKRVEGYYKFFAQLNLDRAQNRRRPEEIETMAMPFNPNRFNFTKISDQEIFFDIGTGDGNNVVAANVSPIEFGHCLFLPQRLECLPQVVTEFSMIKVTELMLLSKSPYLRAMLNSLCAHASVNHLHWHLYYVRHKLFIETADLRQVSSNLHVITDYPAPGFCLKLSAFKNDAVSFAIQGFRIMNYLQEHEIAYNVYMTRAKSSSEVEEAIYDDLRLFIWPRKKSLGVKDTKGFLPACCEFGGHLSIRNEQCFKEITEAEVSSVLRDAAAGIFHHILNDVIKLVASLE